MSHSPMSDNFTLVFMCLCICICEYMAYMHIQFIINTFDIFLKQLYNELHICFETTKSNEAILQQRVVSLQDQLVQKEQENIKLKERLQKSQGAPPFLPENDSDHSELIQVRYTLNIIILKIKK